MEKTSGVHRHTPSRLRLLYFQLKERSLICHREVLRHDIARVRDVTSVVDIPSVGNITSVLDVTSIDNTLKIAHRLCDDALEKRHDLLSRVWNILAEECRTADVRQQREKRRPDAVCRVCLRATLVTNSSKVFF